MRQILSLPPSFPYVVPFVVFLLFLATVSRVGIRWVYPLGIIVTTVTLVVVSRGVVCSSRISRPWSSSLLGVLVFMIWIAPDSLWPSYRQHWLFQNPLTGEALSTIPSDLRSNVVFLFFRVFGTAVTVPIIEELFWRGWLMRYLISPDFRSVPPGSYTPFAFWGTAVLFASEHGSFWDVGLISGLLFNAWMIRQKNIGDCILAHAITNLCLAAYVLVFDQWQYWL
jgi:CAAX prenyl protease-like protein